MLLPIELGQARAVALDIQRYPEFLPWCKSVVIEHESDAGLTIATSHIETHHYRTSMTTRNEELDDGTVIIQQVNGPFKKFVGTWRFEEKPTGCLISFDVRFEFNRRYLNFLAFPVLEPTARAILARFECRARDLFVA